MKIKILKILLIYIIKQKKITKYSDIYRYLKSKNNNNDEAEWPKEFKGITDKIKLKNKKVILGKNVKLILKEKIIDYISKEQ